MRTIKFRTWNPVKKMMELTEGYASFDGGIFSVDVGSKEDVYMQYTGLKDKNDKEIYEGDIVKSEFGKVEEVVWVKGLMDQIAGWYGIDTRLTDELEIIGNIYENKDLLNE